MSEATDLFMKTHQLEVNLGKDGRGIVKLDGRPIATTYLKVESKAGDGTAKVTLGLVAEVSLKAEVAEGELRFRVDDVVIAKGDKTGAFDLPSAVAVPVEAPQWAKDQSEASEHLANATEAMRASYGLTDGDEK